MAFFVKMVLGEVFSSFMESETTFSFFNIGIIDSATFSEIILFPNFPT